MNLYTFPTALVKMLLVLMCGQWYAISSVVQPAGGTPLM